LKGSVAHKPDIGLELPRGVLLRFNEAKRAKMWTTPGALQRIFLERFVAVTELDVTEPWKP